MVILSLVYTSALNGSQTTREWFANQMRVCVNGTANLYTVHKQFAYHSPQIEIRRFFVRTHRELDAPGVLCSPQIRGKVINRAPHANGAVCKRCTHIYKALRIKAI